MTKSKIPSVSVTLGKKLKVKTIFSLEDRSRSKDFNRIGKKLVKNMVRIWVLVWSVIEFRFSKNIQRMGNIWWLGSSFLKISPCILARLRTNKKCRTLHWSGDNNIYFCGQKFSWKILKKLGKIHLFEIFFRKILS